MQSSTDSNYCGVVLPALQSGQAEHELRLLRAQLNPHFLFNTLNTVTSLIRLRQPQDAIKAVSELSLMLRQILTNEDRQLVSLKQELAFTEAYLQIQQLRFGSRLRISSQIAPECMAAKVPFMILQPLVENAIQHGIEPNYESGLIGLEVTEWADKTKIRLTNPDVPGRSHQGFGIGLRNCRNRLRQLYRSDQLLTINKLGNNQFETLLLIPKRVRND